MATIEKPIASVHPKAELLDTEGLPWLESGERMDARAFLERYEQTPEHVKAELIEGIVYVMGSPLSIRHARSDNYVSGCIFVYTSKTPGTAGQNNATTVLGDESVPQPDSALLILPEFGGRTRAGLGDDGFTHGGPELVAEIAFSSRSVDLHGKLRDYERAGVQEYVVVDLNHNELIWFEARDGRFEPLSPDSEGIFRSRVFPGFWIDPVPLMGRDLGALAKTLNLGLASPEHAEFVAELQRRRAHRPG